MADGLTFILSSPRAVWNAIEAIKKAGRGWIVTLREPRRSNAQNDKFWAMVGDIIRAKPEGREHSPEVWKALLMADADFKPLFERSLDGMGVIPVGYKSSRLRKAEFSDLIEATYAYGVKHGVRWTEPKDQAA